MAALLPASLLAALEPRLTGAGDLTLSVSHDRYTHAIGGVQILVSDEQLAFNARGGAYLHLAPVTPRLALAPEEETPFHLHATLDGTYVGVTTYDDLAAVLAALQPRLPARRRLVLHCVLGHKLSQIARCTTRSRHRMPCSGPTTTKPSAPATTCCGTTRPIAAPRRRTAWHAACASMGRSARRTYRRSGRCSRPCRCTWSPHPWRHCRSGRPAPTCRTARHRSMPMPKSWKTPPACTPLPRFLPSSGAGSPGCARPLAAVEPKAPPRSRRRRAEPGTLAFGAPAPLPIRAAFVGFPGAHKGWPAFQALAGPAARQG